MKQKSFFFLTLCILIIQFSVLNNAQIQSSVSFSTDIMSRYVWRGLDLGRKSPSIQPTLNLTISKENCDHSVSVGCWASYTLAATTNEEVDLFLTYNYKSILSVTVYDYFFPGLNSGSKNNYFEYNKDSTGHLFEFSMSFNGTENIPFYAIFSMNFFGNDAKKINDDGTMGNSFLSKYIEVGYKTHLDGTSLTFFMGAALDKPNINLGEVAYYLNKKAGIINVGLKATKIVQITENYELPMQFSLIGNPDSEQVFAVVGITF